MFVLLGLFLVLVIPLAVGIPVGHRWKQSSSHRDQNNSASTTTTTTTASAPGSSSVASATSVWEPQPGISWQIILSDQLHLANGKATPDVDVYDLDLFATDATTISALHSAGKRVICYFSAGSYENWRPDINDWNQMDLGNALDGWPGERWVKVQSTSVRNVMKNRIKMAHDKGCDAIDPDNVDGYENNNGLGLTEAMAVDFVKFLGTEAAALNMAIGLKNAGSIISNVLDSVQFAVNEQCAELNECSTFQPFIDAGKPVFHIEYPNGAPSVASTAVDKLCQWSGVNKFSTVIKKMSLDGWVEFCDYKTYT